MTRSQGHFEIILFYGIVCLLALAPAAMGVPFAGGTGEPNDPYQIATAAQLIGISSDPALYNKSFILTADIDLDPDLPGGKVFEQAVLQWTVSSLVRGAGTTPFQGCFDGNGHTVRNCVIYNTSMSGFLYTVGPNGTVRNLNLENVVIGGTYRSTGVTYVGKGSESSSSATSSRTAGALAGRNEGLIVNCSVTGTIDAQSASGGLVGVNAGIVANCRADGEVMGASDAGGLAGINEAQGRIISCATTTLVWGGQRVGGLLGTNTGIVQYCSADGYVWGDYHTGGLVADNAGSIRASCSAVTVAAIQYAGGLVVANSGTIANCYVTGPVSPSATYYSSSGYCDALVVTNNGTLLTSYTTNPAQVRLASTRGGSRVGGSGPCRYVYYLDANKKDDPTGTLPPSYGATLSDAEMQRAASFVAFDFYGDANDGPAGHWFMPPDGYPVLTWQTDITGRAGIPDVSGLSLEKAQILLQSLGFASGDVTSDYSWLVPMRQAAHTQPSGYVAPGAAVGIIVSLGEYLLSQNPGDGSPAKPYQIETPGQFDHLYLLYGPGGRGMSSSQQHFILTADIDLSRYVYAGAVFLGWVGEFDGNGHTLRNLQINTFSTSSTGICGLFSEIKGGALVHDLTIEQACVYATEYGSAGMLAGRNDGQVLRCRATGQITGGYSLGGLVGANNGQLTDCLSSGRVRAIEGRMYTGGLVGSNAGTLTRCCARDVDVSGDSAVGGLAGSTGSNASISLESCYATGTVRGASFVGGLVGMNGGTSMGLRGGGGGPLPSTPAVTIRQCYAACAVTGTSNVGGCTGWASVNAQQESCFFLDPNDGGGPDNGLGTPLTGGQMKQQASFPNWDFTDTWTICEARDYPHLKWEQVACGE